jgi:hypothetical protein
VNIDEDISSDGIDQLKIKFASAEGYFVKEYHLNEDGLLELYNDFINDYYINTPCYNYLLNSDKNIHLRYEDPIFDTHKDILNKEFQIFISEVDNTLKIDCIIPCSTEYWMTVNHVKPFVDYHDDLEKKIQENDERESYNSYLNRIHNNEFEYGGLRGEEAVTCYWNTH